MIGTDGVLSPLRFFAVLVFKTDRKWKGWNTKTAKRRKENRVKPQNQTSSDCILRSAG